MVKCYIVKHTLILSRAIGYIAKKVCDSLDMLPQTYQTLINKKNFSFADMKRILDCMNVELKIDFVPAGNDDK